MPWIQGYDPLGHLFLSAAIASLPVIVLLGLLAFSHVRAHLAALAGLLTALAIAVAVFGMPPPLALAAAANGAAYGLFPIGWIVLTAIFVYDITVVTGKFDVMKDSIAQLASDRRIQALLIAFSFGAFIEGAAGFGTPVAISAAMLIGLGFKPLQAASLALIGNTAPVAFGALGTPIIALARVTQLPLDQLSAMVGRQLPFFSLIVPFWLVWAMCGFRGMVEVWPACLVSGATFALAQFAISNYHGPWVVDIAGAILSILSLIALLRVWTPKTMWRFDHDHDHAAHVHRASSDIEHMPDHLAAPRAPAATATLSPVAGPPRATAHTPRAMAVAWMPWALLSVLVFAWGLPPVKAFLNDISNPQFAVPLLDRAVWRAPPVVPQPKAEEAVFAFNWLSATGTSLLVTAQLARLFMRTLQRVRVSLLTISFMMALGFVTRYAGLDATMGLAFASSGFLFPFFSPLLGWLGVALTGSDTSSNVLFGNLQQITAQQLGFSPLLAAAANSSGGVMGKMIDAQSIVVASVATEQQGHEGTILRNVFWHSLALAILVGLLVLFQAYAWPGVLPAN